MAAISRIGRLLARVAGLVGGVLAASGARAVDLPEDRGEAMFHVYNGGGVTANGPALLVRKSIVLADLGTYAESSRSLLRMNAAGDLDSSFGKSGRVDLKLSFYSALSLDAQGRITQRSGSFGAVDPALVSALRQAA